MEISFQAEALRAKAISSQLGGVYGRSSRPEASSGDSLAVSGFGSASVVSLSYQSFELSFSGTTEEFKEFMGALDGAEGAEKADFELPEAFTPDAVSGRIVGFVKSLFQGALATRPDLDMKDVASQMVQGVEEGFKQAEEILKSLRKMTDSIAKLIGETHHLTTQKLGDFFSSYGMILDELMDRAAAGKGAEVEASRAITDSTADPTLTSNPL